MRNQIYKTVIASALIISSLAFGISFNAFAQVQAADDKPNVAVSAPSSVAAGSEVTISVSPSDPTRDFVSIVSPDTPEGKYTVYKYPRGKDTVELEAPEVAGEYEVRLLSGEPGYPTLASQKITVTEVTASISVPETVDAGSPIEVEWEGPANSKDFVTIVEKDAAEGTYNEYRYPKNHNAKKPLMLTAPETPGDYEVRYLTGNSRMVLARAPVTVKGVEGSVSGPEQVDAGSEITVSWEGPNNKQDFITIVKKDAKEGEYGEYRYPKNHSERKPLTLRAPEFPGEYEIRYITGKNRYTLASFPFTVTGAEASLTAPKETAAGSPIEITWEGPDNKGDFITIVPTNAKEGEYDEFKYVASKQGPRKLPVVELRAPEMQGDYEIRYVTGKEKLTLASAPLTVTAVSASLEMPQEVMEGAEFEVRWEGPDNQSDYITIVPTGEKEGVTGESFAYVKRKQGPRELPIVQITAPEEVGEFEVRYVTGKERFTLVSEPVKVVKATASIEAPEEATVREVIDVSWEGPGNNGDYIAIVKPDSAENEERRVAYVRRGKELQLETPLEAGEYELQYITAKKQNKLARKPITILPSKVPGELKVVADDKVMASLGTGKMSVALILDASGSMLQSVGGKRRIEIAKNAVKNLISGPLKEGTPFALRVFGHKEKDSCRTDLEIPLAPLDESKALSTVNNVQAMNYAKTPIAKSLELVKTDLAAAEGYRVVVVVTDGEETCDGNPKKAIQDLIDSGFETRVNIVGFAIDEYMLKETFKEWARVGNGTYFDAQNAEQLEKSILEAIETPYEVLNEEQQVVASGVVNGEPLSILPGSYTVKVLSTPEKKVEMVEVSPEELRTVEVTG